MRYRLFSFLFALLLISSCKKTYDTPTSNSTSTLDQGLLLYMPLNGNLGDSSGNSNHGTAFGSISYTQNKYFDDGRSLLLNGSSRIEIPGQKFDGLGKFTIYVEFMPYTSNAMVMVSKTMHVPVSGNTNQSFNLSTNYSGNGLYFNMKKAGFCSNQTLAAYSNPVGATATPLLNAWNYAAVIFDGITASIYMNGVKVGQAPNAAAVFCNDAPLQIGAWWNGDPLFFNGRIDELRIYNRALTDQEVKALYSYKR